MNRPARIGLAAMILTTLVALSWAAPAEASIFRGRPLVPNVGGEKEVDPPVTPPPTNQTPEPGTLILATIGAGGVAAWKRFRNKAQ